MKVLSMDAWKTMYGVQKWGGGACLAELAVQFSVALFDFAPVRGFRYYIYCSIV